MIHKIQFLKADQIQVYANHNEIGDTSYGFVFIKGLKIVSLADFMDRLHQ